MKSIIVFRQKSTGKAFLLTLLFGNIGLFYSSILGGIVMTAATLVIFLYGITAELAQGAMAIMMGIPIVWVVSLVWSLIATKSYNRNQIKLSKRMNSK